MNEEEKPVPEPDPQAADANARKAARQIADVVADSLSITMKGYGYSFVLAYCPEDRLEDLAVKCNPDPSDPNWKPFLDAMGRRLMLMDHGQWRQT